MKIFVVRHGFAGTSSKDPKQERERPLMPEGVAMVKATAASLIAQSFKMPASIFCSPFTRATQTADILGNALGVQVNIIGDMSPIRPLYPTIQELLEGKYVKLPRVMLVGHHDNLEPVFRGLAGDDDDDPTHFPDIAMAECRYLVIDRKTLEWKMKWSAKPSDSGLRDVYR